MLACLVTPWEASGRPVAAAPAGATRQGGEVAAPVVVQAEVEGSQGEDFKTSFQTTTGLIPRQVHRPLSLLQLKSFGVGRYACCSS